MNIELRQVSHAFGARCVFHEVSGRISNVQALALIGPSGGGKSTLLRLLAGLISPDAGEIFVEGQPLPREESQLRLYRRHLGIVFQAYNLFPHLTALENIMLPLTAAHNREPEEAQSMAMALLERLNLADHARQFPAQLSGGQRQRVAIARALAVSPRLIFFDEPTSALDPEMTAEVLELIEELKREGRQIVLVTHAMNFARRVADHVAFIGQKTIIESAPASELFSRPRTEICARFLERVLKY